MERCILRMLQDHLPSCVYLEKSVRKCRQHHLKHKSGILEEYAMEVRAWDLAELYSRLSLSCWSGKKVPLLHCYVPPALTGPYLEVGMSLGDIYSSLNECFAKLFWPKCSFELVSLLRIIRGQSTSMVFCF